MPPLLPSTVLSQKGSRAKLKGTIRLTFLVVVQHQIHAVSILVARERIVHVYRVDAARAPVLPPDVIVVRDAVRRRVPVELVAGLKVLSDGAGACPARVSILQFGVDVAVAAKGAYRKAVLG
jgi:hypothetical protein